MPCRCRKKKCGRKRFSVRTKTVMDSSNLGFQSWAIAKFLLLTSLKSVSSMKLHRDLQITQKSAWHLAHRLRLALAEDGGLFSGPVEVDETYLDGKKLSPRRRSREVYLLTLQGRAGGRPPTTPRTHPRTGRPRPRAYREYPHHPPATPFGQWARLNPAAASHTPPKQKNPHAPRRPDALPCRSGDARERR